MIFGGQLIAIGYWENWFGIHGRIEVLRNHTFGWDDSVIPDAPGWGKDDGYGQIKLGCYSALAVPRSDGKDELFLNGGRQVWTFTQGAQEWKLAGQLRHKRQTKKAPNICFESAYFNIFNSDGDLHFFFSRSRQKRNSKAKNSYNETHTDSYFTIGRALN